jgi:membrane-associated protease RseP (regulator of RpoE activity)
MQRSSLIFFLAILGGILAFSGIAGVASVFWKPSPGDSVGEKDSPQASADLEPISTRVEMRHVEIPFLGVSTDVHDGKVTVQQVTLGTGAARAGVRAGDVVVAFDGRPLEGPDGLNKLIRARKPGDQVALRILRDGKALELEATLGTTSQTVPVFGEPSEGGTVSGKILDAQTGEPILDATVETKVARGQGRGTAAESRESTRTGAEGRYRLAVAPSQEPLELHVHGTHYERWQQLLSVSGDLSLDVHLTRDARAVIGGTLKIAGTGEEARDVTVRAIKDGFLGIARSSPKVDQCNGKYEIALRPGKWTVQAYTSDRKLESRKHVLAVGGEDQTLNLELAPKAPEGDTPPDSR